MPVVEQHNNVSGLAESNLVNDGLVNKVNNINKNGLEIDQNKEADQVVEEHLQQPIVELNDNFETVIVFDWDDTLLASSCLASHGYALDSVVRVAEVEAKLRQLERSVINTLTLALKYAQVHIITNAEAGWVELSCQKFMPAVVPLLSKVSILSARSTFEPFYPDSPLHWKLHAFESKLAECLTRKDVTRNVLSFGDSHVEREAVRTVTKGMECTRTKSVKFAERPSFEQLRRQLDLVAKCFQYIYSHEEDLDLMLTISLLS